LFVFVFFLDTVHADQKLQNPQI